MEANRPSRRSDDESGLEIEGIHRGTVDGRPGPPARPVSPSKPTDFHPSWFPASGPGLHFSKSGKGARPVDLADRIQFEGESTTLDFKREFYHDAKKADLISDVMAMANADSRDDRFIVFGVKLQSDGQKTIFPVTSIPDPAVIEQLVLQNIEPTIHLELSHFDFEGQTLAFLRIHDCDDPPYLMKKDYKHLKQGQGLIRKGTTTLPISRKDLDRMQDIKAKSVDLGRFLKVYWDAGSPSRDIRIPRASQMDWPSQIEIQLIQSHIDRLEHAAKSTSALQSQNSAPGKTTRWPLDMAAWLEMSAHGGSHELERNSWWNSLMQDPYARLSLEELKARLPTIEQEYKADDLYHQFMEKGLALNVIIQNDGPEYLDDAVAILTIPSDAGLRVAKGIPRKPNRKQSPLDTSAIFDHLYLQLNNDYPLVSVTDREIVVKANLAHVKNGLPTKMFGTPLRVSIDPNATLSPIPIECQLVARGLKTPFTDRLQILPE